MTRGYNNDPRRLVRMRRLKKGPRPPEPRPGERPGRGARGQTRPRPSSGKPTPS